MSFLKLIGVEIKKLRRSKIMLLLFAATLFLWVPSVLNAQMNFEMQAEGILPEHNFLIQGFLGMAWFLLPAGVIMSTVLLKQTEEKERGILKMLTLPVSTWKLNLAKLTVLILLLLVQTGFMVIIYFASAGLASGLQQYDFLLPPLFVLREAGMIFLSSIPMTVFFWMLAVCMQSPVFAIGAGLAAMVPTMLLINTEGWFLYPAAYPLFVLVAEYGKLASGLTTAQVQLFPWIPAAILITCVCFGVSCCFFGRAERR